MAPVFKYLAQYRLKKRKKGFLSPDAFENCFFVAHVARCAEPIDRAARIKLGAIVFAVRYVCVVCYLARVSIFYDSDDDLSVAARITVL